MGDNETPQEAWNMADATLKRLSRILDQSSFYSQSGNLVSWFHAIMDLRRNLFPFMTEKEFEEAEKKLKEIPKGWVLIGNKVRPDCFLKVNQILNETFMFLYKIMKVNGLLMPKAKDVRKSILDM